VAWLRKRGFLTRGGSEAPGAPGTKGILKTSEKSFKKDTNCPDSCSGGGFKGVLKVNYEEGGYSLFKKLG